MDLILLFLPDQILAKLTRRGYLTTSDLDFEQIRNEHFLTDAELEIVERAADINHEPTDFSVTPLSFLNRNGDEKNRNVTTCNSVYQQQYITTTSKALDEMFGGMGVPTDAVTNLYGFQGCGKTQLLMQLCANVQIPKEYDGVEGEAIFIDTEGSFSVQRMEEIATGLMNHLQSAFQNKTITVDGIMKRIYVAKVTNFVQLVSAIDVAYLMIQKNKKIKLLVIDSVSFVFRYNFVDLAYRSRILNNISRTLNCSASQHVAVLTATHATLRMHSTTTAHVPALGETWIQASTHRVFLESYESPVDNKKIHLAEIERSPFLTSKHQIPFIIVTDGIRDYDGSFDEINSQLSQQTEDSLIVVCENENEQHADFHSSFPVNCDETIIDSFENQSSRFGKRSGSDIIDEMSHLPEKKVCGCPNSALSQNGIERSLVQAYQEDDML